MIDMIELKTAIWKIANAGIDMKENKLTVEQFEEISMNSLREVKNLNIPVITNDVKACEKCRFNKSTSYHDQMWCRDCQQKNHFEQIKTI